MGAKDVLNIILEKFPSSAGLRTAQGWTFLHVAIEKKRLNIVSFACQTPSLNWILNMQDNDGNTPLHFAVKSTVFYNFCSLCGNMEVDLSLANNNKQTPLDLSTSLFPRGLNHVWNNDQMIYVVLNLVGAKSSSVLLDHIVEMDSFRVKPEDKVQEAQKMKEASQMLGIGSVLIATVSFGATFAVPGGFIADDHANRGTPTLAGRYAFDAFMMANALAFICSSIATVGVMFTGSPLVNLVTRQINYCASIFFMSSSLTCLATAFALGVYMVLAPVANSTGIAICVLSPLVMLYRNFEYLLKLVILAWPLCLRMGLFRALKQIAMMIVVLMFFELWPFILIFSWAAISRKLRNF
uniref:PGG domain-containing protein n=1 Tax=Hordeum vulgare subsp. vulgare TaxID=112509 RepID=A0A8I6WGK1_HORVV